MPALLSNAETVDVHTMKRAVCVFSLWKAEAAPQHSFSIGPLDLLATVCVLCSAEACLTVFKL